MTECWVEQIYKIWDTGGHWYIQVYECDDLITIGYSNTPDGVIEQQVGILDSQVPLVIEALQCLLKKREEDNG